MYVMPSTMPRTTIRKQSQPTAVPIGLALGLEPPAPHASERMPSPKTTGRPAPRMRLASRTFHAPSSANPRLCMSVLLSAHRGGNTLGGRQRLVPLVVDVRVVDGPAARTEEHGGGERDQEQEDHEGAGEAADEVADPPHDAADD